MFITKKGGYRRTILIMIGGLLLLLLLRDFYLDYVGNSLIYEAETGNRANVQRLISIGADPNSVDSKTRVTPLIQALENGHADIVQVLLEHGADPNRKDWFGHTALADAYAYQHQPDYPEIVKLLKKYGAQ